MFIIIMLLLAFTFYLIYEKLNNTYSVVFILGYLSIILLCFFTVVYINIKSLNSYLFAFERIMFRPFSEIYISVYSLRSWIYFAVAVYISAMYWAASQLSGNSKIRWHIVFGIAIVLFWYLNSFGFTETLFIQHFILNQTQNSDICKYIYIAIRTVTIAGLAIMSAMPHIMAIRKVRRIVMVYKKRQLTCFSVMLFLTQLLFAMVLFIGPLNYYITDFDLVNMFDKRFLVDNTQTYLMFFGYTLVLIFVSIFFIAKYKVLNEVSYFKRQQAKQNLNLEFNDIKHIFHSCKNSIVLLEMLNTQSLENLDDKETLKNNLMQSNEYINNMHTLFAKFLNSYKNEDVQLDIIDCNQLIYKTVGKLSPEYSAYINISITGEPIYIYGDDVLLSEALSNVITNSAEAIRGKTDGKIDISLFCEDSMACIIVKDNGCGIEKKNLKKIFKPLYSTKKTFSNWGLGLTTVERIIKSHLGFIEAVSTPSKGTQMQIALPLE